MGYEWIAIAIGFGVATGIIGRAKGNSFLIWFLIGAILPVIGLVAVLLSRNEDAEPERQCPNCRKIVKLYVQVCPRCGTELYLPDPSETRMPPPRGGRRGTT